MKAIRMSWVVALGFVLAGCSHAPTADIESAKQSLADARLAQAAEYAPEAWTAAQDADAKLEMELDAQEKRWSALRSYAVARQLALDTKVAAERSREVAVAAKEQTKTEVATLMTQAREGASRAREAVSTAPHGKGTEADLAGLKADATSIDDTLAEMQRAFDAGDYLAAKAKAQAAIDAAKQIEAEIEQAKSARRAA